MVDIKLLGITVEEPVFNCPTGAEISLIPYPSAITKLSLIAEGLLPECTSTVPYIDYERMCVVESSNIVHVMSIDIGRDNGPPDYLFSKEKEELTKEERYEFKDFSNTLEELHDAQNMCSKTDLLYLIRVFQYELLGEPLGKYFKGLIYKLHHDHTEFYRLANNTSTLSYEIYLSNEIELSKRTVTHEEECIDRFNDLVKGLLPECPRHLYDGRYYASELFYLKEDQSPPFHIFSKEPEDLVSTEREESRFLNFIFAVLGDRKDMCDKVGILYLIRVFQYELLGYPLSLHFKELLNNQRKKNMEAFKLADSITKHSYNLYLSGISVKDLNTAVLPECSLELEQDSSNDYKSLDEITKSLLPNCSPADIDVLRPLYLSEVLIMSENVGALIGFDKDPPFHLFPMEEELVDEESEEIKEKYKQEFAELSVLAPYIDIQDVCDKGAILYLVKILQYKLLEKPLGKYFKEFIEDFDDIDDDDIEFYKLAASIAQRSYEQFKLYDSI